MKNILYIFMLLSLTSEICDAQEKSQDLEMMDWILGSWQRTNVREGQTAFEKWHIKSSSEYLGIGYTMAAQDTVFVEHLSIIAENEELYYVADVAHNENPVYFKITEIQQNGFTCENLQHDFPKKIEYKQGASELNVVISGDGKSIPFRFIKMPH